MADKFTPYALTALPPPLSRDPFGIYFIRTATGFKIYMIANTPTKDAIEIDAETLLGVVRTTSDQEVDGIKTFKKPIKLTEYNTFPIVASNESAIQMADINGRKGIHITSNTNKAFFLDLSDLSITSTELRVVPLSPPAPDGKGGESYVNYLGFKRVFEFSQSISLSNTTGSSFTTLISNKLKGWDGGEALLANGGNWDITWDEISGSNRTFWSLKDWYNITAQWNIRLRTNGSSLYIVGRNDGITLTIPQGAKLTIW